MNEPLPAVNHVAIIMDGNGRWAQRRNLERSAGHRAGADNVLNIVRVAKKFNIKYLTLYAFSTENWKRPAAEVNALMELLREFLANQLPALQKEDVRLNAIGRLDQLPEAIYLGLKSAMWATRNNRAGTVTLALNYGGRAEIARAASRLAAKGITDITEEALSAEMYTCESPDPDLIVRTAGEERLSNFLLWQSAYSEFYFTDTLWPDFDNDALAYAIEAYGRRKRKFGGVK